MNKKKSYPDECLERANLATPGPWKYDCIEWGDYFGPDKYGVRYADPFFTMNKETGEFIAHARTDVPELARRLKKACEVFRKISQADGFDAWQKLADQLEYEDPNSAS